MAHQATIAGRWNGFLGRLLLVGGFAAAAGLDPWSLSERNPAALSGSLAMAARQAQAVVVAMSFLQLLVAGALTVQVFSAPVRSAVAWLTGLGAVFYAAGYMLAPIVPIIVWLIPLSALLNFLGFGVLLLQFVRQPGTGVWRVALPVICLGMLLDAVMGLIAADPGRFLPAYLGDETGVRLRMLRLARAAAIALPVVALLYQGLSLHGASQSAWFRRGQIVLWIGVGSMSAILAVAGFTIIPIKYLLCVPATATFVGVCIAFLLAYRCARPLETWGWLLVAASMGAGLLMGLYAFDGPFPEPAFLGDYSDFPRRLSRLGHAYCIVFGLASVFLARSAEAGGAGEQVPRGGLVGFVMGTVLTLLVISLVGMSVLDTGWLAVGPAVVALALAVCLGPGRPSRDNSLSVVPG